MHVYKREVDPQANDSLAKIVKLIPSGARILDIGTGSGALGRYLSARECVLDGLTYHAEEAELAFPHYARLEIMNLEEEFPSTKFGDNYYDVIVCADILEHLRNAEAVLADLSQMLSPAGKIIISIPNPTYMGVVFSLLNSEFSRTEEGLLDRTHVQFFDRRGLENIVRNTGLFVEQSYDVRKCLLETEFAMLDTQRVPACVRSYIYDQPDSDVYQFVWVLRPGDAIKPEQECTIKRAPLLPKFAVQLFIDCGQGFDEANSHFAWGEINETIQTLVFDGLCLHEAEGIRLDFCDRPGVFEFVTLRFLDQENNQVAEWTGDWSPRLTFNACQLTGAFGEHGGRLIRAVSNDPWVLIPVQESCWACAVRAEVIMSAPIKYLDIAFGLAHRTILELEAKCAKYLIKAGKLASDLSSTQNQLSNTQNQLSNTQNQLSNTQNQLSNTQNQLSIAQRQLAATEIAKDKAEEWAYKRLEQLDLINRSIAFRLLKAFRLVPQK